jgi:hypothetical protein
MICNNHLFIFVMIGHTDATYMKSSLVLLFLLLASLGGCKKKSSSSSNDTIAKPCLKGKFIADACNGSAILQIIEPLIDSLKESVYLTSDGSVSTEYVIITTIPDAYKDGESFYFNVEGSLSTYLHDHACSWPKYSAEISGFGKFACGINSE